MSSMKVFELQSEAAGSWYYAKISNVKNYYGMKIVSLGVEPDAANETVQAFIFKDKRDGSFDLTTLYGLIDAAHLVYNALGRFSLGIEMMQRGVQIDGTLYCAFYTVDNESLFKLLVYYD